MQTIETFREKLQILTTKFEKDKTRYLSKGYLEAQVRIDFINPFFKALGWDIENKALDQALTIFNKTLYKMSCHEMRDSGMDLDLRIGSRGLF